MYTIEKNVKVPEITLQGRPVIYPWTKMEVGDSFVVPLDGKKSSEIQSAVISSSRHFAKQIPGLKAVTRSVDGGVRVWRIA